MVEPPSAMYVQSRGSVIDIGVLASDEETGTGAPLPAVDVIRRVSGAWSERRTGEGHYVDGRGRKTRVLKR